MGNSTSSYLKGNQQSGEPYDQINMLNKYFAKNF